MSRRARRLFEMFFANGCVGKTPLLGVAVLAAAIGCEGSAPTSTASASTLDAGSSTATETPPLEAAPAPYACGLHVAELALYQGVKISLAKEGVAVPTLNAPIIAGRQTLVRAFLAVTPGDDPGNVTARVRLDSSAGTTIIPLTGGGPRLVSQASTDAQINSTLNFDIPGEAIRSDTRLTFEIDTGATCAGGGRSSYPTSAGLPLAPIDTGVLKVVLVPISYDADGSGRLPNTAGDQLESYRRLMMAYYPTREVQITVHATVRSATELKADDGWSTLLDSLRALRQSDNATADLYYYGLVSPAASFTTYCRTSCTAGLSYLAEGSATARLQVGAGIGFTGTASEETASEDTIVHELGHQHGRNHTPCGGGAGVDVNFPYANGGIGVWGIDFRAALLENPLQRKDMMGYCSPQWISDYNYAAIAQRRRDVTISLSARQIDTGMVALSQAGTSLGGYRTLLVDGKGQGRWGLPLAATDRPVGHTETALILDASGKIVDRVTVYRTPYGHGLGSSYEVPMAALSSWSSVQIGGASPLSYSDLRGAVPRLEPLLRRLP